MRRPVKAHTPFVTRSSGIGIVATDPNGTPISIPIAGNPGSLPDTIGTGDVFGPDVSVDSEVALFNGTTGKLLKRAAITGLAKLVAGVLSAATAAVDFVAPGAVTTSGLTQSTNRLLGRTTASGGAVEEISVGAGLSLAAGVLNIATGGGGVPAVLLGYVSYSPVADTPFTIASATLADVDATNLKVTFSVPASGQVLVRLTAYANTGTAGQDYWWSLREDSTDIAGAGGAVTAATGNSTVTVAFVISGLTPDDSHTWKWSHARATSGTARMFAGPGGKFTPPAMMEVWAA